MLQSWFQVVFWIFQILIFPNLVYNSIIKSYLLKDFSSWMLRFESFTLGQSILNLFCLFVQVMKRHVQISWEISLIVTKKMTNLNTKISYATDISVEEFCGRQLCENERGTLGKEDHQNIDRSSRYKKNFFHYLGFELLFSAKFCSILLCPM